MTVHVLIPQRHCHPVGDLCSQALLGFVEVYSAVVHAFPWQKCFVSIGMFGGTLQGEVDQNTLLFWLLYTFTASHVTFLDQWLLFGVAGHVVENCGGR